VKLLVPGNSATAVDLLGMIVTPRHNGTTALFLETDLHGFLTVSPKLANHSWLGVKWLITTADPHPSHTSPLQCPRAPLGIRTGVRYGDAI
jgi:hypothetical protein